MPLDLVVNYPNVRKAVVASNYFGLIIKSLLDELISFNSYLIVSLNNIIVNTKTQSFFDSLSALQVQLLSHVNLYQVLYEKSIDSDYPSLESSITNDLLPLVNSSNFFYTLLNVYLASWQTELTLDNQQYYSIDDFNYIHKTINELNKFASDQLLNSYKNLQNYYMSSSAYYYPVVFYRSKIYIFSKLVNTTDNLMKVIDQDMTRLNNGQNILSTDFDNFKTNHDLIVSLFLNLAAVQKNLFHFESSTRATYGNNIELSFNPMSDAAALAAIYADEKPPIADVALNAWRFINTNTGYKINWYFGNFAASDSITYQNVVSIFFIVKFHSTVKKPFITIYTQKLPNQSSGWYGSKKTFTIYSPDTTSTSDTYLVYLKSDPTSSVASNLLDSFQHKTQIQNDPTDISFRSNNGQTDINNTDKMFLINLSTDSSAPANSVDFSITQFGFVLTNKQVIFNTKNIFPDLLH